MRFFIAQMVSSLVFLGIQFYLYRNIRQYLLEREHLRKLLPAATAGFLLFNVPIVIGVVLRLLDIPKPDWVRFHVMPAIYIWHFSFGLAFFLILLGKLLKLPALSLVWLLDRIPATRPAVSRIRTNERLLRFNRRRREVLRQSLTLMTGAVAVGSTIEVYRRDRLDKTSIRIPIKNLPDSFHGFSIALITDIHSGVFMDAEQMRTYAEEVNGLGADLIAVTGDFVNSSLQEAYPFREAFSILSAPHGVYGVLGNHDYYTRAVDDVAREVTAGGIEVLRNRRLAITRNGDRIHLAGIDDTGSSRTAARLIGAVTPSAVERGPGILLCHRPYFFPEAESAGFGLTLAGHTHGGQVVLGEFGKDVLAPARLVSPYVAGLYTRGDSKMYVSRGVGMVGVPIRFNCPPEITKIVLERPAEA